MKKSSFLGGSLLVVVVAVAAAGWWWHRQVLRVEDAVRTRLVDPASAHFSSVRYYPRTHTGCGLVEAKKVDGEYASSTPFVLDPDGNVDYLRAHGNGADAQQRADSDAEDLRYREEEAKFCAAF